MTWTFNSIKDVMRAEGSHWWDAGSMRFFGTRTVGPVFNGENGVFFVTSEKKGFSDERRVFSIRQFNPETKDIKTVGEFGGFPTRSRALTAASHAAGNNATLRVESLTPVSDADDLRLALDRAGIRLEPSVIGKLISLAKQHQVACELQCNTGEDKPRHQAAAKLRKWSKDFTAGQLNMKLGGDPRGCTVKLLMPNGVTNDFGKEGYCVPMD